MSKPRPVVALELLGSFLIRRADDEETTLRPSSRRLIALLAVEGPQARAEAAGKLWPDVTMSRALANLRTVLWRCRAEAGGLVAERADLCVLRPVSVDLQIVRDWIASAFQGEISVVPDRLTLDLLPSWDEFWLIAPREEFRFQRLHALEEAAQRLLHAGRLAEAAWCARAAVTVDPLRESARRLLLEITLRQGNQVDALRQFNHYRSVLHRETGMEPSPFMVTLIAQVTSETGRRREAFR